MMCKKHNLIIIFVLLGITLLVSVACTKSDFGFEGAWYGEDTYDDTQMWLWITNHAGVYELIWYDDECAVCYEWGNSPSCLIVASGHKSEPNTLTVDGGKLYCYWDEGVELLEDWGFTAIQTYDPENDAINQITTIDQLYETNWTRTDKKKPEQVTDPKLFSITGQ